MDEIVVPEWAKDTGDSDFYRDTKERYKQIKSENLPRDDLEFLYAAHEAFMERMYARGEGHNHQLNELRASINNFIDEIKDKSTNAKLMQIASTLTTLNIGYESGKKALSRMGAAGTNLIKSTKVKQRQDWYLQNYKTMLSIVPAKRSQGKIATVAEMMQTLADKFEVSLQTARNDITAVRKDLRKKGVIR